MFSRVLPTAMAIACTVVPTAPATAESFYGTAIGGLTRQSGQSGTLGNPDPVTTFALPLDSGFAAGGAVGWRLDSRWRFEAEFMYQSVDHPSVQVTTGVAGDGNYASTSVALNVLRDFDLGGSPWVRSYLGAGFAYLTEVDLDFEQGGAEISYSGSGSAFQLLAGVRYQTGGHLFADLGARYLIAGRQNLTGEAGAPGTVRLDYEPFALTFALGWRF